MLATLVIFYICVLGVSTMKRPGATRDEHKKICQACLSRFLVLRPLDCKDSAKALSKKWARENPTVFLSLLSTLIRHKKK